MQIYEEFQCRYNIQIGDAFRHVTHINLSYTISLGGSVVACETSGKDWR